MQKKMLQNSHHQNPKNLNPKRLFKNEPKKSECIFLPKSIFSLMNSWLLREMWLLCVKGKKTASMAEKNFLRIFLRNQARFLRLWWQATKWVCIQERTVFNNKEKRLKMDKIVYPDEINPMDNFQRPFSIAISGKIFEHAWPSLVKYASCFGSSVASKTQLCMSKDSSKWFRLTKNSLKRQNARIGP